MENIHEIFREKRSRSSLSPSLPSVLSRQSEISLEIRRRGAESFPELFIHDERKTRGSEFSRVLFYELFLRSRGFSAA